MDPILDCSAGERQAQSRFLSRLCSRHHATILGNPMRAYGQASNRSTTFRDATSLRRINTYISVYSTIELILLKPRAAARRPQSVNDTSIPRALLPQAGRGCGRMRKSALSDVQVSATHLGHVASDCGDIRSGLSDKIDARPLVARAERGATGRSPK